MWKLLRILLVLSVPTSPIVGDKTTRVIPNFHEVYTTIESASAAITSVIQTKCKSSTICHGFPLEDYNCQRLCQHRLALDVNDFYEILPNAFYNTEPADFETLKLTSDIPDCMPKTLTLEPESFAHLPYVKTLELDCVKVTSTTNPFKTLESIAELRISKMAFRNGVDSFLKDFPKLEKLSIVKVNLAFINRSTFSQIRELQELHLQYNNLTAIRRNSVSELHTLTRLTIIDNDVTDLRNYTFSKLAEYDTLSLYRNKINTIRPKAFSKLSIHTLDLSQNQLVNLPDGIFKSIRNMGYLYLQFNNIETIGKNTFEGVGRIFLDLSFNKIHSIEPGAFADLYFTNLELHNNKFDKLEADSFNGLQVRENVQLSNNELVQIKDQAFRNLTAGAVILECNNINPRNFAYWGVDGKLIHYITMMDIHCY